MATSGLVQRARGSRQAVREGHRLLSVVAWGRNLEGQCGQADMPVVAEPTEVEGLSGLAVRNVQGGRAHAAAVLETGEVLTWGCGHSGKLGHGGGGSSPNPTRIEALVGRANVRCASLGAHHSLFLDQAGGVWSCGENKEGQCGLGTPLETLAAQRRAEWDMGAMATPSQASQSLGLRGGREGWGSEGQGGASSSHNTGWAWAQQQQQQQQEQEQSAQHANRMAPYLQPYAEHTARQAELDQMRRLMADSQELAQREAAEQRATRPGYGPAGQHSSSMPSQTGPLSPGQLATPMRIGQDLHGFLTGSAQHIPAGPDGPVVSVAASRYFSAQVTADGRVWTYGGGFNGELGGAGSSWLSAAHPVDGPIAEALEGEGGAVHVAAGSTFCVCLAASGRVAVWGHLPGDRMPGQGRAGVQVLAGLPSITQIAAGSSHALLSDGERVWAIGRWLSADGAKPVGGSGLRPQEVLDLRGEGVLQLTAGAHSSAAVTGDGRLMLWGKLLAHEHATSLASTYGSKDCEAAVQKWGFSDGMGADVPMHVPGLHNVKGIALGATHATVLLA